MKKFFLSILFFAVIAVFALQFDDKLNPEVTSLIEKVNNPEPSEAYIYLMGISAPENHQPKTVGKQRFEHFLETSKNYSFSDENFNYSKPNEDKKLTALSNSISCSLSELECLKKYFNDYSDTNTLVQQHSTLIQRYRTFLSFNEYNTQTQPSFFEIFPEFTYLSDGNKLTLINAIYIAKSKSIENAYAEILTNIKALRASLTLQDTLIGELIFLEMISNNLDILALLKSTYKVPISSTIESLSGNEKSLQHTLKREMSITLNMISIANNNPEFLNHNNKLPSWVNRIVFKPNMTSNQFHERYRALMDKLKNITNSQAWASSTFKKEQYSLFSLRNFVGNTLVNIGLPAIAGYKERYFHIDNKITLLNWFNSTSAKNLALEELKDPYFPESKTIYFESEAKRRICFDGILETRINQRCLYVSL